MCVCAFLYICKRISHYLGVKLTKKCQKSVSKLPVDISFISATSLQTLSCYQIIESIIYTYQSYSTACIVQLIPPQIHTHKYTHTHTHTHTQTHISYHKYKITIVNTTRSLCSLISVACSLFSNTKIYIRFHLQME